MGHRLGWYPSFIHIVGLVICRAEWEGFVHLVLEDKTDLPNPVYLCCFGCHCCNFGRQFCCAAAIFTGHKLLTVHIPLLLSLVLIMTAFARAGLHFVCSYSVWWSWVISLLMLSMRSMFAECKLHRGLPLIWKCGVHGEFLDVEQCEQPWRKPTVVKKQFSQMCNIVTCDIIQYVYQAIYKWILSRYTTGLNTVKSQKILLVLQMIFYHNAIAEDLLNCASVQSKTSL